ncbi:MAG: hypothetical protein IPG95_12155 [Saprospiraceae bacterium]|nr:hypothetical protein [Saprospiraceae bacterium]
MNYALDRLNLIGFNADQDWALYNAHPDEPHGSKVKKPIFWSDAKGNLCIGIFDLNREFITVDIKESSAKLDHKIFHFVRWAEPKVIDGEARKITPFQGGHGVFPYIPLQIVEKFREKQKIKNLVITEGQIKAYVGAKNGLDIVGIPGIEIWNAKGLAGIFKFIADVILVCQVETITWLTDADSLFVEWKEDKDLGKRPRKFLNSVMQFKERTADFPVRQFFAHIKEESLSKGIDDLIIDNPAAIAVIRKELQEDHGSGTFFKKMEIGAMSSTKLKAYFGLDDNVKSFYDKYEHVIGNREFVFLNGTYKYDEIANKVKYIKCGEASQFIMVDSTFFIKGPISTKYGEHENTLKPIKRAGIMGMFKNKSEKFIEEASLKVFINKLIYDIPYYNGFVNRPSHIAYQKEEIVVDRKNNHEMKYYNRYFELSHNPEPGPVDLSLDFVKHIFGTGTIMHKGKLYNEWELGLDYIQLLYMMPTMFLPILCLVSKERGTGKTKFWEWMGAIFQQNVKPINSQQLNGNFTSLFASSLLVYIDEAFLDKKETIEKLKSLVTTDKGKLEYKGVDADLIDNYMKVGVGTNDETSFVNIPEDEVRFWVRKVQPIPEAKLDRYWYDKLRKEIPAFLYFLQQRKIVTVYEHRQWFHPDIIKTDALDAIVKVSKTSIEHALEMVLCEHMSRVKKPIIYYSSKDIKDLINDPSVNLPKIRWALEEKMGLKNSVYSNPYEVYHIDHSTGSELVESTRKNSIYYTITASSLFDAEGILNLFSVDEILEMERKEFKIHNCSLFWKKFNPRNKLLLKKLDVFSPREESALDIIVREATSFAEAYQASLEINQKITDL